MSCDQTIWTPNGDAVYSSGAQERDDAGLTANNILQLDHSYWIPPYRTIADTQTAIDSSSQATD